MIRFVADVIGHISLSRRPPCPDRQVGEVAPAPRLDVRISMVGGERESKKDRSLSKFLMLTTESGWPTEDGQNPKILASQGSECATEEPRGHAFDLG
jgi:hypothetical protein